MNKNKIIPKLQEENFFESAYEDLKADFISKIREKNPDLTKEEVNEILEKVINIYFDMVKYKIINR